MEQKLKFIIIGFIGVLIIFLIVILQISGVKQKVQRERDALKEENTALQTKIERIQKESSSLKDRLSSLDKNLTAVSQEKDEMQKRYETLVKEKDKLVEEINSLKSPKKPEEGLTPKTEDAYWGKILKAKTDLELQLDNMRSELRDTRINMEQAQREKASLQLEANNLNREKEDCKRQIEYNQKLVDSLSTELARETSDKLQINNTFKLVKGENAVLKRQLESLSKRKINLERKLAELQDEKAAFERGLGEMETLLKDKVNKINDLRQKMEIIRSGGKVEIPPEEESVELPAIVVRPQAESAIHTSTEGKVLAINRDNRFVIINLGEDSGIKLGDALRVYREGKNIATVEVIQIRQNISACDIKSEPTPIRVGDEVK